MPGEEKRREPVRVLYQSAEDGIEDTIKPRLINAGANCDNVAFIDTEQSMITLDDPEIEQAIIKTNAKLLILDPLQAFLGLEKDMLRAGDMRPMMQSISDIANRTDCAIIIIGHMNKSSGMKSLYRGLGSIDIAAAARSILLVGRVKDNPSVRMMAHIKSSLAPEGPTMAFEIDQEHGVKWIGKLDISLDSLLYGNENKYGNKYQLAVDTLSKIIDQGEKQSSEIYTLCLALGIGKRTVDEAKKELNVRSVKKADKWYWTW